MDGYRARLARHSDEVRMLVGTVGAVIAMLSVLVALLVGIMGLLLGQSFGIAVVVALLMAFAAGVGWATRQIYRDHIIQVTGHLFRWNDSRNRFWELPLGAFSGASVEGRALVLYRNRADSVRLRAAGVHRPHLLALARTLDRLIRKAQPVETPPEALQQLRGPEERAQTGRIRE
jgi:hypothetical protein